MVEPPLGHHVVDMLEALPEWSVPHYGIPDRMFRREDDIPPDFHDLNKRYCRVVGPPKQWEIYLQRLVVWDLWHLALASEAVGRLAVA